MNPFFFEKIQAKKFKWLNLFFLLLFFFYLQSKTFCQTDTVAKQAVSPPDSIVLSNADKTSPAAITEKRHSPNKAALESALLPGLGQAYNKKYWKIPVVYAGFGVMTYFIVSNNREYVAFREAYSYKLTPNPTTPPPNKYATVYTSDQLKQLRDSYRHDLELSYIITGAWYIIQILDAAVDAHFFYYDITDDLSLNVQPVLFQPGRFGNARPYAGVSFTFNF